MKIATWNVNSLNVRLPHVLRWLDANQPAILALQELKMQDSKFPHSAFEHIGYHAICHGQKTYNGVALISRTPAQDVVCGLPGFDDPQARVIGASIAGIRVINVYVPNGQAVDSDKYRYKLAWYEALHKRVANELRSHSKLVLLGDYNVAPESRDVHDPQEWEGQVLVSKPERAAFNSLLELGLNDSFRLFKQAERSFSWWDYRGGAFRRDRGMRIDHILVTTALAKDCTGVAIDRQPRGWERPSDHTPVVATLRQPSA